MTPGAYFLVMVVGLPVVMLLIALIGASLRRGDNEQLLDWKPTRSPRREAELHVGETQQMLNALNGYRRSRGAPELRLQEVAERGWASLRQHDEG